MKYVRKWWLLKRNRIICPEVAVNGQFCLDKRKFWNEWLKIIIGKVCLKNQNFLWNCLKNQNFSEISPEKSNFFTRIHDPHISNQVDATELIRQVSKVIIYCMLLLSTVKSNGSETLGTTTTVDSVPICVDFFLFRNQATEQDVQLTNDHHIMAVNHKRSAKPVDQGNLRWN